MSYERVNTARYGEVNGTPVGVRVSREAMALLRLTDVVLGRLEVIWDPENEKKKVVFDVHVIGTAWKFENGLKVGMTLEEVEKINGKPFKISGFAWDYGGYANFEGGKLFGKVSLRFNPSTEEIPEYLMGDKELSSTDKKLRAAKPMVEAPISVFMKKTE